jgi:hypothetical protein
MRRRRIPNSELEFLEDSIACAVGIIRDSKALLFWLEDPDAIRILALIMERAQWLRQSHIELMNKRKEGQG